MQTSAMKLLSNCRMQVYQVAKVGNICWYYVQDAVTKKEGYVYGGKYNSGVAPYLSNARP